MRRSHGPSGSTTGARRGARRAMAGCAAPIAALLLVATSAWAQSSQPRDPATRPGGGALQMESDVSIRIVPDPLAPGDSLTVGDPFWTTVIPSGPRGYYLLPESVIEAYRPRPELAVLGSERRDGRLRLEMALFRVGDVVLPEVDARVVDAAGDTVDVPVVSDTIAVASVLAPGDTLLADIKPLWEPARLPAWVVWALAAAALLLAGLAIWWWRRRRAGEAHAVGPRPEAVDPHSHARRRIEAAAARDGSPLERIAAAGEIGDAVRDYLATAWRVPARERTTFELLASVPRVLASVRSSLGAVLAAVDLAKFARVDPGVDGLRSLAGRGLKVLDRMHDLREPPVADRRDSREVAS